MMGQLATVLLTVACVGLLAWALSTDPGDDPWIGDPDEDEDEDIGEEWIA